MADIHSALKAIATANVALTALVGARVHHIEAAQNTAVPYVTFLRISDIPGRVMGTATLSGLRAAHYQFDAWANTQLSASAVAAAVFGAYDDYRGTSDTIVIDKILMEFGPEDSGDTEDYYRCILEAWVHYRL